MQKLSIVRLDALIKIWLVKVWEIQRIMKLIRIYNSDSVMMVENTAHIKIQKVIILMGNTMMMEKNFHFIKINALLLP